MDEEQTIKDAEIMKAMHDRCEEFFAALPAYHRRRPSAHVFTSDPDPYAHRPAGMIATIIFTPNDGASYVLSEQLIALAVTLAEKVYGTRGVQRETVEWGR